MKEDHIQPRLSDNVLFERHILFCETQSPSFCRDCFHYYEIGLIDWKGRRLTDEDE